jgi:lipopolysaccharide transport system permease protein
MSTTATDYATQPLIVPVAEATDREPAPPAAPPIAWIVPQNGWQPVNVRELWRYRELLYFLVWRDVKVRYKQTALGAAWAVLQPLLMMAVFTIFFRRMAGVDAGAMPYAVFCYLGLLPWTFFATAVGGAGNSVVSSERLITKIYFPRLAVPFAAVGAAVVDFLVALTLLLGLMAWYGVRPGMGVFLLPLIFAEILLLAAGIGTLLASLNVSYRDFRYVIPFMLQVWMFATPTIYMQPKAQGGALHVLLNLNPMTSLVAAFRAAWTNGPIPFPQLAAGGAAAVVALCVGCLLFRRAERRFADII